MLIKVQKVLIGSYLRIKQLCSSCGQKYVWDSQPMIRKVPAGNIQLSAAILYAGALPSKVIRVLTFLKCETISVETYFRHQWDYLQPTVSCVYSLKQTDRATLYIVLVISIWYLLEMAEQTALDTVPNLEHTQSWKCHATRLLTSNWCRCECVII